jgi:hypothetical protein
MRPPPPFKKKKKNLKSKVSPFFGSNINVGGPKMYGFCVWTFHVMAVSFILESLD